MLNWKSPPPERAGQGKPYSPSFAYWRARAILTYHDHVHIVRVNGEYDACLPGDPFYRGACVIAEMRDES